MSQERRWIVRPEFDEGDNRPEEYGTWHVFEAHSAADARAQWWKWNPNTTSVIGLEAVEVVPARALEAALEEARELREKLHRVEGDCAQWKHAAEEWEKSARSALVSGGRDGE